MLVAQAFVQQLAIDEVLEWKLVRPTHSANKNGFASLKDAAQRGFIIVPFTRDKCGIPGSRERLWPGHFISELRGYMEKGSSRQQHRSRGHAHGTLHCSHTVSPRKGSAAARESVEV